MAVKTSVTLTDEQHAYACGLVASGRFESIGAVFQHGLKLVRQDAEAHADRIPALQGLIDRRRARHFVPIKDADEFMAAVDREG